MNKPEATAHFDAVFKLTLDLLKLIPAEQRTDVRVPKESLKALHSYFHPRISGAPSRKPAKGTYSESVLAGTWDLQVGDECNVLVKRRSDAAPILARYMPDRQFTTHIKGPHPLSVPDDPLFMVTVKRTA